MTPFKLGISLASALVIGVVFASVSAVPARGQCANTTNSLNYECQSATCIGGGSVQEPAGGEYGVHWFVEENVTCCNIYTIPNWVVAGLCDGPVKANPTTADARMGERYVFIRGCDGKYRLTTLRPNA